MYVGYAMAYWVEVRATCRKVAGSIPDAVIEIFHCLNSSGHNMTMVSTEPLTEISTRDVSWLVEEAGA